MSHKQITVVPFGLGKVSISLLENTPAILLTPCEFQQPQNTFPDGDEVFLAFHNDESIQKLIDALEHVKRKFNVGDK